MRTTRNPNDLKLKGLVPAPDCNPAVVFCLAAENFKMAGYPGVLVMGNPFPLVETFFEWPARRALLVVAWLAMVTDKTMWRRRSQKLPIKTNSIELFRQLPDVSIFSSLFSGCGV